jgi:hypothetical protein
MPTPEGRNVPNGSLSRRHLRAGWIGLLVFLTIGIVLETLHGLKMEFYLDPRNGTRRLMWTLAHAHGTLFSLVNIGFAVSVNLLRSKQGKLLAVASRCLLGGLVVLPLGFFLGGCWLYGGDPGVGVFVVPVGALLMLAGVGTMVMVLSREKEGQETNRSTSGGESAETKHGATNDAGPTASGKQRHPSRNR